MMMTIPENEKDRQAEKISKKKLIEDLKTVVNDAEELLKKTASDRPREWLSTVQARAAQSLKAANDWIAEEEAAITSKARATAKAAEDFVQANTWMVLGMIAVAGVVVGILAGRLGRTVVEEGKKLLTQDRDN
jgi:ElaB/YqjD/DUF883 family membrane-anchored ribosome-binding protein